jgi:hypothetical protein
MSAIDIAKALRSLSVLKYLYFFLDTNNRSRAGLTASRAPGKSSALGPIPTQPLIGIKLQMYIKLNTHIYILYWYFQQSQCLNIRKTYSTQHVYI